MPVLINVGRLLMLGVWAFLLLNLVHPFPRPMNIFVNVAFIFTTFMHALQMVMLKNGLPKDGPQMTGWQQLRVFIFGVFELLVWMKKFKAQAKKSGASSLSLPLSLREREHYRSGVNPSNRDPL